MPVGYDCYEKNSVFKKIDDLRKRYYKAVDEKQAVIDLINENALIEYYANASDHIVKRVAKIPLRV